MKLVLFKDVPSEEYVAHPLNSLSIMKRLGYDYHQDLGKLIEENSNKVNY